MRRIFALITVFACVLSLLAGDGSSVSQPSVQLSNDAEYEAALKKLQTTAPALDAPISDRMDHLLALALAENNLRHYDKAEAHTREILKSYPDYFYLHSLLSIFLGKQGKYKDAEAEILRTQELNPKDSAYCNLVLASWEWHLGRKEAALTRAKSVAMPTDITELRNYHGCLSSFYSSVGDEQKIELHIKDAIKLAPDKMDFFKRDISFDPYRNKPWFIKLVGKTLAE